MFEIGRRFLSARIGLLAAVIATLQPYLVWHDVHGNREILDQLLGAGLFGLALLAIARRSVRSAAALGAVCGVAILSNSRLLVLPLALAAFLLWRGVGWAAVALVPVIAAVVLAPWVVRTKLDVGCFAITTDARALWKANNLNTYATLAAGGWLDQVPDIPQRQLHLAHAATGEVDQCTGGRRRLPEGRQDPRRPRVRADGTLRAPRLPVLGAPSGDEGEARDPGDRDALESARRDRGGAGERRRLAAALGRAGLHPAAVCSRSSGSSSCRSRSGCWR